MSHIFISYSRDDRHYARTLADVLLERGFNVWIDDRLIYGDHWWHTISQAIDAAAAVIVIMTPSSDDSIWVQREVALADNKHKTFLPLLLAGDIQKSKNWTIFLPIHYLDVRGGALPPEDFYERLTKLLPPSGNRGSEITSSVLAGAPRLRRGSARTGLAAFAILVILAILGAILLPNVLNNPVAVTPLVSPPPAISTTETLLAASSPTPDVVPSTTPTATMTPTSPPPTATLPPQNSAALRIHRTGFGVALCVPANAAAINLSGITLRFDDIGAGESYALSREFPDSALRSLAAGACICLLKSEVAGTAPRQCDGASSAGPYRAAGDWSASSITLSASVLGVCTIPAGCSEDCACDFAR